MNPMQTKTSFDCHVYKKSFNRKDNLNRHLQRHIDVSQYNCDECGKVFNKPDNLLRHQRSQHQVGAGKRPLEGSPMLAPKRLKQEPRSFYDLRKIRERKIEKFYTTSTVYKANVRLRSYRSKRGSEGP